MAVELSAREVTSRNVAARRWADPRTRSVWLWQLILALSVGGIGVAVTLLDPLLFTQWQFSIGLIALVLITCATLAIPWHLVPASVIAAVPLLDIVAIGILSASSEARLGFLWVFPITWIATYYTVGWLIGALALTAAIQFTDVLTGSLTPTSTLQLVIAMISLGFLAVTINIGARKTRAFSRLLRRQFTQLGRTLRRVEAQEERASSLFNSLGSGLARVDREGTLLAVNDAYRAMYGVGDLVAAHPTGAVEYATRRGEPLAPSETTLARAARGEALDNHRVWLFATSGTWRALDVTIKPVTATPAQPASALVTAEDVTAELDAEEDRKSVTSVVSHELRNPLTAIVGHTDLLLERDDLPADMRAHLDLIDNAAQRMQHLLGALLSSPPPKDPRPDGTGTVDLRRVVAASVDAFRAAAVAAQVTIDDRIDSALPTSGDAFRLRQVVDNLVGNAVKYTLRGGAVEITARRVGDTIELVIADTGIGMSSEDLAQVFDPYFRSASVRDSTIPGTGLGMGIARDLIEQQGGTLTLTSTTGKGTRATVRLPALGQGGGRP